MTKFPCRCSRCEARVTLAKHPDEYVRPRKCWSCGSKKWRVDRFRKSTEHKRYACGCHGYGFIHRRGSKWCEASTSPPAADEYRGDGHIRYANIEPAATPGNAAPSPFEVW